MPGFAHAQILINELQYDASGTDTDQEYVELYNSGSASVDLTGWKVNDGSNHTLNAPPKNGGTGSLTIAPGGYVLIVDNATNFLASHPGLAGIVIDAVLSLSNTGATVSILDSGGTAVDSVSYTKDQGANGDGNSLQRSSGIWIAAAPTPNTVNASGASTASQSDAQTSSSTAPQTPAKNESTQTTVSSYVAPPSAEIFADGGTDRSVVVGADTEFRGRAYNRSQDIVENVRFNWNFGDGTTAEGVAVMHHFDYPGRYAVFLTIAQNVSAASDKIVVTAEPANLAFIVNSDASVSITNNAGRDIDISKWIISSFGRDFVFPDGTDILAGETLRIAQSHLGFTVGMRTEFRYPNGVRVEAPTTTAMTAALKTMADANTEDSAVTPAPVSHRESAGSVHAIKVEASPLETATHPAPEGVELAASAAAGSATEDAGGSTYIWPLSVVGLIAVSAGTALAVRRMRKSEWNIVEETK
ncbi:lamin tail domain-containing protein [Candidatus Kaiserbacteria bacterium]|nr:lamin tail domain-containing protein [Candidatus Kaiserbacteria bacterium]